MHCPKCRMIVVPLWWDAEWGDHECEIRLSRSVAVQNETTPAISASGPFENGICPERLLSDICPRDALISVPVNTLRCILISGLLFNGIAFAQNVGDVVRRLPALSWTLRDSKPSPTQFKDDRKRSVRQLDGVLKALDRRARRQPGYAALVMGEALAHGVGVSEDVPAALSWLSLAAQQGVWEADYQLGRIYEVGNGVPPNVAMAVRYYREAADHLNTSAQLRLGVIFQRGLGVAADMKEAQHWYETAANHGNAEAAELLGDLLATPGGDYAQAVRWYRVASSEQNSSAQIKLAVLLSEGKGTPQDPNQAIRLLVSAAQSSNPDALFRLGQSLTVGYGSPVDYNSAYILFSLAAASGSAQAAQAASALEPKMKGDSLSKAQAAASAFWSSMAKVPVSK